MPCITRLTAASALFFFMFGCEPPAPAPPVEEEIPEAYKIMMAAKNMPSATSKQSGDEEKEGAARSGETQVNAASEALSEGDLASAITLCDEAQKEGNACITTHAMAHYLSGDLDRACKLFATAKSVSGLSPELAGLYAVRCTKSASGKDKQVEESGDKSHLNVWGGSNKEGDPVDRSAAAALGKSASKKIFAGDPTGALKDCKEALKGGYTDCHRIMGLAHKTKGDNKAACVSFDKALTSNPGNSASIKKQMEALSCS